MALREIGARLTLDGEAEWNSQMKSAERNLKNVKSALAANQAEFAGCANTTAALTSKQKLLQEQFAQQKEKIRALEKALQDLEDAGEGSSRKADSLRDSLNYAKVAASKTQGEIKDLDKYLQEAEKSADGCATSIDEFGKKTKEADEKAGGLAGALRELIPGLDKIASSGTLTAAAIGTGVVGAAKGAYDWMMNLVDETEDLRTSLAKLETSAEQSGIAFDEELTENLTELYRIADGDWDSAFEALQNLLQADYDESLPEIIDLLAGAVIEFPDTLKIESLADSLQETLATGAATGQFAELLERLGLNLDDFNARLGEATTAMDAQNLVAQTLSSAGLADVNAAYAESNAEMIALTEAEANLELTQAALAEAFVPLKTRITEVSTGLLEFITNCLNAGNHGGTIFSAIKVGLQSGKDAGDEAGVSMSELFDIMDEGGLTFDDLKKAAEANDMTMGEYVNTLRDTGDETDRLKSSDAALSSSLGTVTTRANSAATAMRNYASAASAAAAVGGGVTTTQTVNGSHAGGLGYVPFDGYTAELHRGEMVLTATQAASVRAGGSGGAGIAEVIAAVGQLGQQISRMGLYLDGDTLVGGIVNQMDRSLGEKTVAAGRGC